MNDQPGPWEPPTEPTPSAPTAPGMPPQPDPAPTPPGWAPPAPPHEPPTAPVPPTGPPPADPPPLGGSTAGWGPPPAGTTGPAVGSAPDPAPQEPPAGGNRAGMVVGLIVLAILVIGGILAAVLVLGSGGTEIALDIERCEIAADGALSASGTVTNPDDGTIDVLVEVTFVEVDGGATVDTDRVDLSVPGDAAERWTASGTAGDDVQQVNCEVSAG